MLVTKRQLSGMAATVWLVLGMTACGDPKGKEYRKGSTASADAGGRVILRVAVPDISTLSGEVAGAATQTTGMAIDVKPVGSGCKTSAKNDVKPYKAGDASVEVNGDCDLDVTVAIGVIGDATLRLSAESPNYDDDIKALVTSKCAGCHGASSSNGDLSSYAALKALAADSVTRMKTTDSGKLMPPGSALPADSISLFEKWVADGSPEKAGASGGTAQSLSKIFYKNNSAKRISKSTLSSASVNVALALDLQQDGKDQGFSTAILGVDTAPTSTGGTDTNKTDDTAGDNAGDEPGDQDPVTPPPTTPAKVTYAAVKPILDAKCVSCHRAGTQRVDLSAYTTADLLKAAALKNGGFTTNMPQGGSMSTDERNKLKEWETQGFLQN